MKHLIWFLIVVGVAGGSEWYFPRQYAPQLAALQQQVDQATKARDEANTASANAATELAKAKEEAEVAEATVKRITEASVPVPSPVAQAPASLPVSTAPTIDPKQPIRDAAKGEKLDQLVTASRTYQGVTIKSVDPAAVDILFADGAARIPFEDMDKAWRDRFQFDPVEAKAFLAMKAEKDATTQDSLHDQLQDMAQDQQQKAAEQAASPIQNPKAQNLAEWKAALVEDQKRLQDLQRKHDSWIADHQNPKGTESAGGVRHSVNIPDDISSVAIQDAQNQVYADQNQISALSKN